jgi:hypothetical protein
MLGPYGIRPGIGSVNLTVPLTTWLGLSGAPGHATGYGPLDADDSRGLAARLAGQPGSRRCITLTDQRGKPVAHGCARAGPGLTGGSRPPPRRPVTPSHRPPYSRPAGSRSAPPRPTPGVRYGVGGWPAPSHAHTLPDEDPDGALVWRVDEGG